MRKYTSTILFLLTLSLWGTFSPVTVPVPADTLADSLSEESPETVTIQLKWFHQFQFAGYYAAKEKGFYRDAGLDVVIKAGGPGVKVDREVVEGRAEFGVLASETIEKRASGEPLILLAVIMQHSIRGIIVRADSGINSPGDLSGHLMMLNRNEDTEFMAMFSSEGVPLEKLSIIQKDKTANRKLLDKKIAALNGSIGNQPFFFEERGVPVRVIRPINYGVDFYGDSLFTSEAVLSAHPERVEAFRRASLAGWEYAMENRPEMIDLIIEKYNRKKTESQLDFEADAMEKLIMPRLVDIGHVNPHRVVRIADTYAAHGIVPRDYTLGNFIYDPSPEYSKEWIRRMAVGAVLVFTLASVCGIALVVFNRRLRKMVETRTAELRLSNMELQKEVAERKKGEAALRKWGHIFENAKWGLALGAGDGRKFELINPAFAEMHGYTVDEIMNLEIRDMFVPSFRSKVPDMVRKSHSMGYFVFEADHLRKDGTTFPGHHDVTTVRDENGRILYRIVSLSDISERRRAEAEKAKLEEELRQAHKMEAVGTLAGGIAHDFNNILSAILGFADLAADDIPRDSPAGESIREVMTAGNRARELVKHILAFGRKSRHARKPTKIHLVVKEALELLRATIPSFIEIRQHIDPVGGTVLADGVQLHQVMINLCTNAAQSMEEKGGAIFVGLQRFDNTGGTTAAPPDLKPGMYMRLSVKDSGGGIDREIIDRIFDPYFTTKEVGKGSGMGLAVVHGIVSTHDGLIDVKNVPGEGTTFHVYFPLIDDVLSEEVPANVALPAGKEHILVVDDEEAVAELTRKRLERLGYTVTTELDPVRALELFRKKSSKFDLVITDQTMPRLTGTKLSEGMLAVRRDIPIILCSGYGSRGNAHDLGDTGISAFAVKPVDMRELAELVRKVLDAC